MTDLLQGLNPAQREAVTATEGFIRGWVHGAGLGKTCPHHRFAHLVNELGILPGNILCVTFTNKFAAMRQRIHALTGDNDNGYIKYSFHGFCVSILQQRQPRGSSTQRASWCWTISES